MFKIYKKLILIVGVILLPVMALSGCTTGEVISISDMGIIDDVGEKKSLDNDMDEKNIQDSGTGESSGADDMSEGLRALQDSDRKVAVYVCGCVLYPGVYELAEGSRVVDAIQEAGGMSKEANAVYINLARKVSDGEQIYVPAIGENILDNSFETPNKGEKDSSGGKVNINTADESELCTIPGIGKTRAEAILKYREDNGLFKNVDEIMMVPGIGESTFSKIQDYICIVN